MTVNISKAKTDLSKLIQKLVDKDETEIIVTKNGKPLVRIALFQQTNNCRLGVAKKELAAFDYDAFNSIDINGSLMK